ncbi:MAG: hypothetical protein N3B21_01795 [Clostridia bacterium]|nr:hypothetical protein [Clostridia bacterium]
MENFYIYLTFDIDQDFSLDSTDYYNRDNAEFEGYIKGLPLIINKLKGLPFSVFLRADYQISKIYGRYDYLIAEYPDIVDTIIRSNGEINWHIHIYEEAETKWFQVREPEATVKRFIADLHEVKKVHSINSNIVRVGECIMNNLLMKAMDEHGIRIDSTALPGRFREDEEKFLDWSVTTNDLYNPSVMDYRVEGNAHYKLLEVPMTTIPMKASYDTEQYRRYVNLAFRTEVLFQNLKEYIEKNSFLVTITHPFEILDKGNHGLIGYNIDIFEQNVDLLIKTVIEAGKRPVFRKVGDILNESGIK